MKTRIFLLTTFSIVFFAACKEKKEESTALFIGHGRMPNIAKDNLANLFIVYGTGDSILFAASSDGGNSFSKPAFIAVLPHLVASSMRGPQISIGADGPIIMACNKSGDIFSYTKEINGNWLGAVRINDVDTIAKEGFLALAADGSDAFAVWLDLRGNKRNKIIGAKSIDGGKTWLKIVWCTPRRIVLYVNVANLQLL